MGIIKLRISEVRKMAIDRGGLWQDFIALGQISGEYIKIARPDFDALQEKHFPGLNLGTIVHETLVPMVRLIDRTLGTKIENCGGCAEREMKLNAATQKLL